MRALCTTLSFLGAILPAHLGAQWYAGIEVATHRYRGSAHDTSATHVAADGRPDGGAVIAVRLDRRWQRWRAALTISYANPGFAVGGSGLNVTDKTTGKLYELSSLISTRVGGIGPSGAVRLEWGPALHLWNFDGELHRRLGAVGAATYEWLIAGRTTGAVRLETMFSKSWFDPGDVPPEYERRVTWRYGVGLGLRYRLSAK